MTTWTYRGHKVRVPWTADIPYPLKPGKEHGWLVQYALNQDDLEPWEDGDDPIETFVVPQKLRALVVPNRGRTPFWAIHRGHKARKPQASPFLHVAPEYTNLLTLELSGPANDPKITRAYQGDYTPPQPWMGTAEYADGGRDACIEFWLKHSYVHRTSLIGRSCPTPPDWYLAKV